MGRNNQKKERTKVFVIIAVLIIISVVSIIRTQKIKDLPQRYSVAKIIGIRKPPSGEFVADFEFEIDNRKFEDNQFLNNYYGKVSIGDRYIISVPEGHPKSAFILFDHKVEKNISPPNEGWEKLPF